MYEHVLREKGLNFNKKKIAIESIRHIEVSCPIKQYIPSYLKFYLVPEKLNKINQQYAIANKNAVFLGF